ncbi:GNAT family N-acetyltransferase [Klebsiella sp. BIGb0407]|uniref:GNAT family N-acetyltransferase n=1 Tax=Klebsiella sp. BIGb0407 TaxID=2940603 RepID=UPI00216851FB|nr:GNAT family N-acetyltransferase [Klebsiella sp. BIGb0407]MCS3429537.1 DNA-binding MarR family transcriptional regulator/predicted GNAT family N-acyltransferase [Klebsiella sp. BIGb0407]
MSLIGEIRTELRFLVRELGLLDKNCFGSGLSLTQAHLLTYLFKNGTTSFNELKLQLNIDKASLSRMLALMADENYAEALSISSDKRQKHFQITAAGREALSKANSAADKTMGFIDEGMGINDAEAIVKGLRILRKGAFHRNCLHNPERIQVEQLRDKYRADVASLLIETFSNEQNIPENLINIPKEYESNWWIARSGEYLLGAVACWKENAEYHWGRFAVEQAYRGLGIGKKLASVSLKECFLETDEIITEARDTTVKIISQLGGETTGEAFDFYGMPVTPMRLKIQDFEKIYSCSNPLS